MGTIGRERIVADRPYDDPYRVLAANIVACCPPPVIKRVLTSGGYVRSLINTEARTMDISGWFLDCVDQEIIANGRLRRKNYYLKQLGEYYYSELDLPRLRREIRAFAEELGVDIS